MEKDTQNVVLVLLSIVVVIVVVLGGGYWTLTYGEDLFEKGNASTKTIIPKKRIVNEGEFALPIEDNTVQILLENLDKNRDKNIVTEEIIYKVAYVRNVVTKKANTINIYEYYVYKEVVKDADNNPVGYKYYSDKEKTNLISDTTEDIDVFGKYSDVIGLYKYSFIYNTTKGYIFDSKEKVN